MQYIEETKHYGINEQSETEKMKQAVWDEHERQERGGKSQKPHKKHNHPSNRQPPKKKRKK